MGYKVRSKTTLSCYLRERNQRCNGPIIIPMRLLQASQGRVTQRDHIGVNQQRSLKHIHTLRHKAFGGIEVVPLAQQIAQTKVVGRAARQEP